MGNIEDAADAQNGKSMFTFVKARFAREMSETLEHYP